MASPACPPPQSPLSKFTPHANDSANGNKQRDKECIAHMLGLQASSADGATALDDSQEDDSDISGALRELDIPAEDGWQETAGPRPLTRNQRAMAERWLDSHGDPAQVLFDMSFPFILHILKTPGRGGRDGG